MVFPRPIEIMNKIEVSRLIYLLFLKTSILVIAYIAYEENTLGHAAPIYGPYLWSGEVAVWNKVCH